MKAFAIDTFDFCRFGERAEGDVAVVELGRLVRECADASGVLHWTLQGSIGQSGHGRLALSVAGTIRLMCQRCLTPFAYRIATQSDLALAPDEESADAIEELLADDAVDVIVGSQHLDVMALVEDDVLLVLPFAPKHDVCPESSFTERVEGAEGLSPFSVLKNLEK